ncbi:flagellar filament capping protein FliD [Cohnella luojiensis]|uniref:Flagellar hook-associated protein 2 n=1 Tax=Cohnella luojiensis TaxID=652876 RepID=A0A4Y8M1N5_9BACL|nr:flagellar filament capping protein FliD [Cohnella luojiensis]TFE29033.1 flagellar cap protein FliD [Cohnella luojiensis]
MRISGFSSGLDIDQIVKDLMKAKRVPLDKLTQQKTTLEWQREQFRDINIKLVDFRNNKLFNYGLEGSINAKQVNITGNTTAVSAKATSSAVAGTITVEVDALATAASVRSSNGGGIGAVDTSQTLSALKGAGTINYTADGSGNVTFTVNGASITLNETTDTLASMAAAINGNSTANANAFVDSETGKMSITSKTTGAGNITFAGDLLDNFDMTVSTAGTDANVIINGIATTRKTNTFTENGVEITLNAAGGAEASLNVVSNTDKIVDTIKSFIKDYNDVFDSVNNKINEERDRKYPPLTADQRADMKEDEIRLWEEKAKSGLLRNDSTLSKLISDARLASITSVTVGGTQVELASLGIVTGTWEQRGKLVIQDEAKLRAAIEADPDQVMKFFTQPTAETDPTLKVLPTNPDNGLFNRLTNVVMTALDELATKAGTIKYSTDINAAFLPTSNIGEKLTSIDSRVADLNRRLSLIETRYFKQFTAMEVAMNKYNAQAGSLFGASN